MANPDNERSGTESEQSIATVQVTGATLKRLLKYYPGIRKYPTPVSMVEESLAEIRLHEKLKKTSKKRESQRRRTLDEIEAIQADIEPLKKLEALYNTPINSANCQSKLQELEQELSTLHHTYSTSITDLDSTENSYDPAINWIKKEKINTYKKMLANIDELQENISELQPNEESPIKYRKMANLFSTTSSETNFNPFDCKSSSIGDMVTRILKERVAHSILHIDHTILSKGSIRSNNKSVFPKLMNFIKDFFKETFVDVISEGLSRKSSIKSLSNAKERLNKQLSYLGIITGSHNTTDTIVNSFPEDSTVVEVPISTLLGSSPTPEELIDFIEIKKSCLNTEGTGALINRPKSNILSSIMRAFAALAANIVELGLFVPIRISYLLLSVVIRPFTQLAVLLPPGNKLTKKERLNHYWNNIDKFFSKWHQKLSPINAVRSRRVALFLRQNSQLEPYNAILRNNNKYDHYLSMVPSDVISKGLTVLLKGAKLSSDQILAELSVLLKNKKPSHSEILQKMKAETKRALNPNPPSETTTTSTPTAEETADLPAEETAGLPAEETAGLPTEETDSNNNDDLIIFQKHLLLMQVTNARFANSKDECAAFEYYKDLLTTNNTSDVWGELDVFVKQFYERKPLVFKLISLSVLFPATFFYRLFKSYGHLGPYAQHRAIKSTRLDLAILVRTGSSFIVNTSKVMLRPIMYLLSPLVFLATCIPSKRNTGRFSAYTRKFHQMLNPDNLSYVKIDDKLQVPKTASIGLKRQVASIVKRANANKETVRISSTRKSESDSNPVNTQPVTFEAATLTPTAVDSAQVDKFDPTLSFSFKRNNTCPTPLDSVIHIADALNDLIKTTFRHSPMVSTVAFYAACAGGAAVMAPALQKVAILKLLSQWNVWLGVHSLGEKNAIIATFLFWKFNTLTIEGIISLAKGNDALLRIFTKHSELISLGFLISVAGGIGLSELPINYLPPGLKQLVEELVKMRGPHVFSNDFILKSISYGFASVKVALIFNTLFSTHTSSLPADIVECFNTSREELKMQQQMEPTTESELPTPKPPNNIQSILDKLINDFASNSSPVATDIVAALTMLKENITATRPKSLTNENEPAVTTSPPAAAPSTPAAADAPSPPASTTSQPVPPPSTSAPKSCSFFSCAFFARNSQNKNSKPKPLVASQPVVNTPQGLSEPSFHAK